MRRTPLLGVALALVLGAAACQEQLAEPDAIDPAPVVTSVPADAVASVTIDDGEKSRGLAATMGLGSPHLSAAVETAINPGNYVCSAPTDIDLFLAEEIANIRATEDAIFVRLFQQLAAAFVASDHALLFVTDETRQSFGVNGEFTNVVRRTDRDIRRFWDIFSDDIQTVAIHGSVMLDVEAVAATYRLAFGVPEPFATLFAEEVRALILASETIDENNPLFSFNAFAFSFPPSGIPDKIAVGDGVLTAYTEIGFEDVAPQAIFAHEFAHHIQFENDYFSDPVPSFDPAGPDDAEETRYTELMADAMAAYYLTHKRGGTLNQKRVEQFLQVFFGVGDCVFDNPNHHGTPDQRMAAARFGFDVADAAKVKGEILTSEQFHDLFVAEYVNLIAPDAP